MRRKIIAVACTACMAAGLTACGSQDLVIELESAMRQAYEDEENGYEGDSYNDDYEDDYYDGDYDDDYDDDTYEERDEITESVEPTEATSESTEEKATETTTETATEEVNQELAKAEEIYSAILNTYVDIKNQGMDYTDVIYMEYPYECSSAVGIGAYSVTALQYTMDEIGYSVKDIDGDGTYELILGTMNSGLILDMYQIKDDKPVQLFSSAERWESSYCGDSFVVRGSDGAASNSVKRYVYYGRSVCCIEMIWSGFTESNEVKFVYAYVAGDDTNMDALLIGTCLTEESITQDEYYQYTEQFQNMSVEIPGLTPLSEYSR